MSSRMSLVAAGHASSLTLAITFALCVAFDLIVPEHAMYTAWRTLLPGFEWLTWKGFVLGFAEAYGYGWYFTLIWVPIYNFAAVPRGRS